MYSATDTESVDTIYRDHHGWLRTWLMKRLSCSETAADLAHDTFLRVLLSSRSPTSLGDEPRALLTHIAKGLVVDHWRRQRVEKAYLEALASVPVAEAPSAEDQVSIIGTLIRIDRMLSSMPRRSREIFLLAQLDGLTLSQISARTDTPIITVRRHIRRALLSCMSVR